MFANFLFAVCYSSINPSAMNQTGHNLANRRPLEPTELPARSNFANRRTLPYVKLRRLLRPVLKLSRATDGPSKRIARIIKAIAGIQGKAIDKACHIDWLYLMAFIETAFDPTTLMLWKFHIIDAEPTMVCMVKFLRKRLLMLAHEEESKNRAARRTVTKHARQTSAVPAMAAALPTAVQATSAAATSATATKPKRTMPARLSKRPAIQVAATKTAKPAKEAKGA